MGRRTVVLIVALVLAVLSAVAIWAFLSTVEDDARKDIEEVQVFRSLEFIDRGVLGDNVLDVIVASTENREFLPDNAISSQEQLLATLQGRISLGPISANAVVTTDQWGDPADEILRLSELLEPGMQALSIRPDEVRGVGGFVQPGDRVNVIASTEVDLGPVIDALRAPGARRVFFPDLQESLGLTDEEMVELAEALPTRLQYTKFILQGLLVVGVGEDLTVVQLSEEDDVVTNQVITLALTAEQAEELVFAHEYLSVWLTLVPEGFEPEDTDGARLSDLIDLPEEIIVELRELGLLAALVTGEGEAEPPATTTTTTTTLPSDEGSSGG